MSEKPQNSGSDQSNVVIFLAIAILFVLARKVEPILFEVWDLHRGMVVLTGALVLLCLFVLLVGKAWNGNAKRAQERGITAADDTSVLLGTDVERQEPVHLKQTFRTMHAQVIGTTNAGKTESVILPWAIQDIKNKSGLLIVDGKSDASFVNKLYAYAKKFEREKDFRLFSLANPDASFSFNPLKGDSAREVTERVFSSFTFENEYYKDVQYKTFLMLVRLCFRLKVTATFSIIGRLLTDPNELESWTRCCEDELLRAEITRFLALNPRDREERTSGLETMIGHFTTDEIALLFEETENSIEFDRAMDEGHILYFQLPTMYYPFLGAATGKLVLQSFQNAVSKRQIKTRGVAADANEPEVLLLPAR